MTKEARDECDDIIAKILFNLGIEPNVTQFIDEVTKSFGYGDMDGWVGVWQYQLPLGTDWDKLHRMNHKIPL